MKNQAYRMTMLYDFYGEMLTERQKEFYDLYYNEDLSLAEIAENYNISRQGVRDVIVRGEAYLVELEDKTGLIRRFHATQTKLKEIETVTQQMYDMNRQRIQDAELDHLVRQLQDITENLIQE